MKKLWWMVVAVCAVVSAQADVTYVMERAGQRGDAWMAIVGGEQHVFAEGETQWVRIVPHVPIVRLQLIGPGGAWTPTATHVPTDGSTYHVRDVGVGVAEVVGTTLELSIADQVTLFLYGFAVMLPLVAIAYYVQMARRAAQLGGGDS